MKKILITGGAGFVGSSLARLFRSDFPQAMIVCFDNLHRRGSELNPPLFEKQGIQFVRGDVRNKEDLKKLAQEFGGFDLCIEASAEPSVHAGTQGQSPDYAIETNLFGTAHCLEFARQHCDKLVFLSTSRVYSIPDLQKISFQEAQTRLEVNAAETVPTGLSAKGISESFPTAPYRSIYGATKLCSEILVQEYAHSYGLKTVINRCGVIAGKGQFGKVDQGVFTLWIAAHEYGLPLQYTGFGGEGKQVRDLLHPKDLYELILIQCKELDAAAPKFPSGEIFNVGGGREISTSLKEWTALAQEFTKNKIQIGSNPKTAEVDIPYYISDTSKVHECLGWQPKITASQIAGEIAAWIQENREQLRMIF